MYPEPVMNQLNPARDPLQSNPLEGYPRQNLLFSYNQQSYVDNYSQQQSYPEVLQQTYNGVLPQAYQNLHSQNFQDVPPQNVYTVQPQSVQMNQPQNYQGYQLQHYQGFQPSGYVDVQQQQYEVQPHMQHQVFQNQNFPQMANTSYLMNSSHSGIHLLTTFKKSMLLVFGRNIFKLKDLFIIWCLGLQQPINHMVGNQPSNSNFIYSMPDINSQHVLNRNITHNKILNSAPFQTIEDTINSFDHLPKMRSSISLQNLHQIELTSSDDELSYHDRNRHSKYIRNPLNLTEMHYLQSQLSRKYEDSKEIETLILGHVPSILESGKMASTRSDIDHNLKNVSLSYERRCKLRQDLRAKLNLPNLVPSMTFDRFHNLVPANQPLQYTENVVKKGPSNIIKLDNMHIEVSNEIMAMIYYRALKGKFEKSTQKKTPLRKSKSFPNNEELPKLKEKRRNNAENKHQQDLSLLTTSDYEDTFLDSGSETDLSTLELSMTREMRIRSLKRYSPRHHNTMLPVIETDNENTSGEDFKEGTKNNKQNLIWQFDDINEPVPPPAPEIRIQKIGNVHSIETTMIPDILKSQKLESKLSNFVVGYDKIKHNEASKRKKMEQEKEKRALNDEIDLEKRMVHRSDLEIAVKEMAHVNSKDEQKTHPTAKKVKLLRQETTKVLKDKNDELKRNLIQLESKLEIIRDKKMDTIEDNFAEVKRSASSEIQKKLSSDAVDLRKIIKSRKNTSRIDLSIPTLLEDNNAFNALDEAALEKQIEAARQELDILRMEELEHKLIHECHDPWISTPEKESELKSLQQGQFENPPLLNPERLLNLKINEKKDLNISDTARKHLGIKDKTPDVIRR